MTNNDPPEGQESRGPTTPAHAKTRFRVPETIMAAFTIVIACAAIAQCHEMDTSGVDTKHLAKATQDLASDAEVQLSSAQALALAASDQVVAMSDMASSQSGELTTLRKSVKAAQSTADAAASEVAVLQSAQRPWIKPDIQFVRLRFKEDDGAAEITYAGNFRNVGRTPALNVHNSVSAVVLTKGTAIDSIPQQRAACALAAKRSKDEAPGLVVFPNEDAPELIGGKGNGVVQVSASEFSKAWPGPNDLIFELVGCFDYQFSADKAAPHGQTGFAYQIGRDVGGGHISGFVPIRGDIPSSEVVFGPDAFSSGYLK